MSRQVMCDCYILQLLLKTCVATQLDSFLFHFFWNVGKSVKVRQNNFKLSASCQCNGLINCGITY